jgi:hypothetical protein
VVELVRPELLTLRALPEIVRGVVGEPGIAEAQRPAMGVGRQPLERERAGDEEHRVAGGEDRLAAHVSFAALASAGPALGTPSGWSSSVKRMSSGSSSVTRLTVWRMPR